MLFPVLLGGCATPFPRPVESPVANEGLSGEAIFAQCLEAHGGDLRDSAAEVQLAVTGEWGSLIQRFQPLVADAGWRIESSEHHWTVDGKSRIEWTGPDGTKRINWDAPDIEVFYNDQQTTDPDVLASTAMTTSAFQLFHLGPSFLAWNASAPVRLPDEVIDGQPYHRLHFWVRPGFGFSEEDEVVAYIDPDTKRMYRVWITLNGFRTTQGATVDVTFLDYIEVDGFVLPSRFEERVRAPISIHAHSWQTTRSEIVKGKNKSNLRSES